MLVYFVVCLTTADTVPMRNILVTIYCRSERPPVILGRDQLREIELYVKKTTWMLRGALGGPVY